MKMKKNLLLIVCLAVFLPLFLKADENLKSIKLVDFVQLVSTNNNINIFVDEELKKENISLFVPQNLPTHNLFFIFKNSMQKLGYTVSLYDDIYYLTKDEKQLFTYFVKLKYNSFENVSKYLTFKKIEFQYIDTINSFLIFSESDNVNIILNDINRIDTQKKQVTLKFTIIEINEDDLKEQGFQSSTTYQTADESYRSVLNTFVLPFQSTNPVFMRSTFYTALKLFNEFKFFKISQNPYILVQDSKNFNFQAVNTIPYQTSRTLTEATNTSEQTSIEYKDVGLKIIGKTLIYDDYINLDLDLIIEDILSTSNNIPTTYKRQLKSNSNLQYGEVLILSGINQTKINKTEFSIPFISNIPYLGELFKYKSESDVKSNISIAIEVIK
ncbi:type II and III secretion system protein [Sulfurimonas crateris]|uniref:Type II and III secretion system protein n=2 Tax=Sulfurimonas crateris TaxID=2574727 RepID=A0A4U2Z3Z8_9BACT|nr:type II and III secretion system protein [Sulfurimonas crateris]